MSLVVGTNSYIDSADADAYFADLYGYDKWTSEANKDKALISAAQHLDLMCSWYGIEAVTGQDMAFPRTPDADPVPQAIIDAQCEIAYLMVDQGSSVSTTDDALTELKAGSVTMKFKATSPDNPFKTDHVLSMITPYGLCGGSGGTQLVPMERQ